jgi:hypothetical protein
MPVSTAIVLFWVHEGMTFLLLSHIPHPLA